MATIIPLIEADRPALARLRRRSLGNLARMGHCAPTVMRTLLDVSGVDADWLVKAAAGLPGGIGNTGEECGGVTAPLMLLGLRCARAPLDRGVPAIVYKGHDLLQRFTACHGVPLCRMIRGDARLPLTCLAAIRRAPDWYARTVAADSAEVLPEECRQAFARLHAHFSEHGFHCAQATLAELPPAAHVDDGLRDAVSPFAGGTLFTGRTCGAFTAGVIALGRALGGIERSHARVLRMVGLMALGGDAFADHRNAANETMNLGYRLSRWFAAEFGSTQCRTITRCDFSTASGVSEYIESKQVERCAYIAQRVGRQVREIIESHSGQAARG